MKKKYKLPETLYYLLTKNKMSQNKLANLMDTGQKSVSDWLRFRSIPSLFSLMALAAIFDVSLDYLVYGEEGK